jgi:hypothetical protein
MCRGLKARSQSEAKSESEEFATTMWNPCSVFRSASCYARACCLCNMISEPVHILGLRPAFRWPRNGLRSARTKWPRPTTGHLLLLAPYCAPLHHASDRRLIYDVCFLSFFPQLLHQKCSFQRKCEISHLAVTKKSFVRKYLQNRG